MLNTLLHLKNNGTLKHLVSNGLMSQKVFTYLEIYLWVDARVKTSGKSLNAIITEAEVSFGLGRTAIWRGIRTIRGLIEAGEQKQKSTSAEIGEPLKPITRRTFVSQ